MAVSDAASVPQALADRPVSRGVTGRPFVAFAVLVLWGFICAPLLSETTANNAPHPVGGEVSFAKWGALTTPVELSGSWTFLWHGDRSHPARVRLAMPVPGPWEGVSAPGGKRLPAAGLATYELTIRDLPPGFYTLHVPDVYAASRVSIDGVPASSVGRVGDSPETTTYLWLSQDVPILSTGRPVRVAIDIAAFHHHDNGFEDPPEIGLAKAMSQAAIVGWAKEFIVCVSLMLLSVYGLVVFIFRPRDRAWLYSGLACISFLPFVAVFGRDNLLIVAFPALTFPQMLAIQYLTGIFASIFFVAYANALFPRESPRIPRFGLQLALLVLFAAYAVLFARSDTMMASELVPVNAVLNRLAFLYVVSVVSAAVFRGRDGALIFFTGLVAFILPLSSTLAVRGGLIDKGHAIAADLLPVGILMLICSQIVVLAERWSVATRAAEETTADLRRLIDVSSSITAEIHLETLLRKIVEATSKFLMADRSSLFLYNEKTDELTAFVAEGLETREIRFPANVGLAGHCFTTGKVVNVANAYKDSRFNREIDAQTGYRTKSVLAMPLVARDGRRIGVMQALNRRDGRAFDAADIARMSAFAAQAAIAIDNATLFSAVASERNYNESILRSMSNGVVTLDADLHVAKINASAAAILGVDAAALVGASARQLLSTGNAVLLEELIQVAADRQPRQLLDIDVLTATDKTISVNVSIVPLVGEGATDNSLLVLFEDITEEKRMQGAMRRFMSKKVVDQVLQRHDDLLFGTSCVASVLFADIRNFTAMAEALSARETVDMLNEIFTELVDAVAGTDGVLDKFIGDAVMAVFGAPLPGERDTANAAECAVQMMHALARINAKRLARGASELRLGIGIATGDVVAGTVGSTKRMDYTVIGDSVNLASRLQVLTKLYRVSIIVSEATAAAVPDAHVLRELDLIRVRGRNQPEKIFQLLTYHTEETFPRMQAVLAAYARGRAAIGNRDWAAAVQAFEEALRLDPNDQPSLLMLERAKVLRRNPPPDDWDGVWSASEFGG